MRLASKSVFLLTAFTLAASAQQTRVTYVYSDGNIPATVNSLKALLEERPDLRGKISFQFLTESVFDEVKPKDLSGANVLVLDVMNQQMLDRYNTAHKTDLVQEVRRKGKVIAVGRGLAPKETYLKQGLVWDDRAQAFWEYSGAGNQLGLLKFVLTAAGVKNLTVPDPEPSLGVGYYYPEGKNGRVFGTWEEFDQWRAAHGKRKPGAPRIAIGFYKASYYTGDTALLNALVAEIEKKGGEAIPVFGYPDGVAYEKTLLDPQGKSRADVALSLSYRFADFQSSKPLEKLDIPSINLISLYGRTEKEWRESDTGLSTFEGTFQVAVPELGGLVAPTVVGSKEKLKDPVTGLTMIVTRPIASQVAKAVERGLRYQALRAKANKDKRVAMMYYNYPPGKANIGASYLNVAVSISNILQRMKADGYDTGNAELSPEAVLKDITEKARNVGGYAPGELQELLAQGSAVRISMPEYRRWLNTLAPRFRAKIIKDWGEPEKTTLMAEGGSLIVPVLQYGNIALMPQPSRAWGENAEKMFHAKDLAPHHQYVAAYAWVRNGFKADALVHVGTHGTLEWLDGKEIGLSEEDAPDALMADLPDIYIYNVDVVGEGLVAKRRGMATVIDHMVPPFKKGGLYPDLAALGELMNDYETNESKNPELAEQYAEKIREQALKLGLAKDLGLKLDEPKSVNDEVIHQIENHLIELKSQNIPFGLHAFGRTPDQEMRASTVDAIVSTDRSLLPSKAKIVAEDMDRRIRESGPRELDNFMRALRGGFISTGSGGEPIRNPDSYATGNNFYGVDPDKVPKPASWEMGVKLADQMLAEHLKKNGKYPEKISFVIWGDETMRHEGVMESQILYLLGAKPVWTDRGKVVDVEVIPPSQLKRPRVDIVIASAAEGMFTNITRLIDKAVQKVKAMDEADNFVRQHYLTTKTALLAKGYSEEDADKRAGVRIFDEPPGIYNLNTSTIAAASGTWDSNKGMADDYVRKMGHGFGNGFWGESMEDVFRMALSGTDKVVHSSSTMLYGALDNDDMFMYMGGLSNAIKNIDGKNPEMLMTNTRNPGKPEMTSMDKFIGQEFRSRYVNPTWIEGMKKEGYAGAAAMREFVEYMWGWDATASDLVDDKMWKETFDTYVDDKKNLGMKEFFEKNSPYAYQDVTARMVETVRKGYWKADDATEKKLLEEYLESVNKHGIGCAEHTCGNPRLSQYMMSRAKELGVPVPAIDGFQKAMEKATGKDISTAAKAAEEFVKKNEQEQPTQQTQAQPKAPSDKPAPSGFEGYLMEVKEQMKQAAQKPMANMDGSSDWGAVGFSLPVLGILLLWRWRHYRAEV
ncbi:MAG: cobaltochelatase subunit CobN [Bryobacteraceae bacterium]